MCSHTWVIISLGFELPRTSSDLPEDLGRASRVSTFRRTPTGVFLFGLASGDAYPAGDVATTAVGSYPTVSPLPDPQRFDRDLIALAIGGLFSVVLVSDHSAWELPSALPMKSGLSSRNVSATSDHPVFSLTPEYYRTGCPGFQGCLANVSSYCTTGKSASGTGCLVWYIAIASGIHFFS
jgi:hypothetical protein